MRSGEQTKFTPHFLRRCQELIDRDRASAAGQDNSTVVLIATDQIAASPETPLP